MTDGELIALLDQMRATLVAVSTANLRIDPVNQDYRDAYHQVADALAGRGIDNPIHFTDLWKWYGRWSAGDLPSYQSRRMYLASLFDPLVALIRSGHATEIEPTGWARVDRTLDRARDALARAVNEEQFQTVGLLCREALISLAQEVFDPDLHPTEPGIRVSATDFKRMIEAYIAVELAGSASDEARKHARSALDLALRLQHQRTAVFRDAAICLEATGSVINIIAIISGRRDPKPVE
jgi:hypothetical protein